MSTHGLLKILLLSYFQCKVAGLYCNEFSMLWSFDLLVILCQSSGTHLQHTELQFFPDPYHTHHLQIQNKSSGLTSDFLPGIICIIQNNVIRTTLFPWQDHIPTCLNKLVQPCSWAKVICLSLTDIPVHDWKRALMVVVSCAISVLCGQIWNRRRQPFSATWNHELPFSSDSSTPLSF